MSDHYILDDKRRPIKVGLHEWSAWFGKEDRRVALTETALHRVSTVFLGLDHSFGGGPPLLFETMVFENGTNEDVGCNRYSTWEEADAGHAGMVEEFLKKEADALAASSSWEVIHDV